MNRKLKYLLFSILSLTLTFGVYNLFFSKKSYNIPELKTEDLVINFQRVDKEIETIRCFSFNVPINNKAESNLKEANSSLTISSGTSKNIICDITVADEVWPLFWSIPLVNLDSPSTEVRSIFSALPNLSINSLIINKNKKSAIATILNPQLSKNLNSSLTFNGPYKFQSLNKLPIKEEKPMCSMCSDFIKENAEVFISQVELEESGGFKTYLSSVWNSYSLFKSCGSVIGITPAEANKIGKPINKSNLLSAFQWDNSLKDGWISSNAVAIQDILDCSFNEGTTQWSCNKGVHGETIIALKKDQYCLEAKETKHQLQCQLSYFTNEIYKSTNNCVNRVLFNLGKDNPIIKNNYPTAKGLSFTTRGIQFTEDSLNLKSEAEIIYPVRHEKLVYPCRFLIEISSVIKQTDNNDVVIYLEKRNLNLDHKEVCKGKEKELFNLKTIVRGVKSEN